MTDDRFDEQWEAWRCSDCDPAFATEDDRRPEKPYVLLVPEGEEPPDDCPRCGSHLSMCSGAAGLRITNTPAERWAARPQTEGP